MELDESNVEIWNLYSLVRDQVKVAPMGEIIGLDHKAVLDDIKLYVDVGEVRTMFQSILQCYQIEKEFAK